MEFCCRVAESDHAMVASMHPTVTSTGIEVLRCGGNAADAALAAALVAGVVEPCMSGIGGSGVLMYYNRSARKLSSIDYGARAPLAATPTLYSLQEAAGDAGLADSFGWPRVAGLANSDGGTAVAVPGMLAGLGLAHTRYGKLDLARVFEPAVKLARHGHEVDWFLASMVACSFERLRRNPEAAALFLPNGGPLTPAAAHGASSWLTQRELAATLERLVAVGVSDFYEGDLARAISKSVLSAGGLIEPADLTSYRPTAYDSVLATEYRGYEVATARGATGGSALIEALLVLQQFPLHDVRHNSTEHLALLLHVLDAVFSDRLAMFGDPEQVKVPVELVLSEDYAKATAGRVRHALSRRTPLSGLPPEALSEKPGCTTHVTVVDGEGNAACVTNTNGDVFGSGMVVPSTGIVLNNLMISFDPRPGHANSIAPGKRPLLNVTPAFVFKDDQLAMAIGAPGGRPILSAVLQVISNVVDFSMTIGDAISAPRVHFEGRGQPILDRRIAPTVAAALTRIYGGVRLREDTPWAWHFGCPNAIAIDGSTGRLRGAVHPSRIGTAEGI